MERGTGLDEDLAGQTGRDQSLGCIAAELAGDAAGRGAVTGEEFAAAERDNAGAEQCVSGFAANRQKLN